jgi:hypothetical protein
MLPLSSATFPTSSEELTVSLQRGFAEAGVTPRAVSAEGAAFPQIARLGIDLTGTQLTRDDRLRSFTAPSAGSIKAARFEMLGSPLYFEKAPVDARLEGDGVEFEMTGDPQTGSLVLKSAQAGSVSVQAAIESLENLLQSLAAEAASKQGVTVQKTKLALNQEGPRAVSFRAEVTAKVFIMNATLALTGRLEIDDSFQARLSNLGLDGDAMVTNLAGSFLRPRLQQLEGRVIPLFAFLPAGLQLRDIQVSVAPALHIQAKFGSAN